MYFCFELLGLSGIVSSSNPPLIKGAMNLFLNLVLSLSSNKAIISRIDLGVLQYFRILSDSELSADLVPT